MSRILTLIIAITILSKDVKLKLSNIDDDDLCIMEDEDNAIEKAGFYPSKHLWKDGIAFYQFAVHFTNETERHLAIQAMWHIENRTCIRFFEKSEHNLGFIHLQLVDTLEGACGRAATCFKEDLRNLRVKRSERCNTLRVWVHELCHSLCLGHEHARPDRDNYLDFDDCDEAPEIKNLNSRGHFYDYFSNQHYTCRGGCKGTPKQENIKGCGKDVNPNGLSVLDVDKINHYYNCQGCYAHRWLKIRETDEVLENLINLKMSEGDTEPVHLCRVYHFGSVIVGRYSNRNPGDTCVFYDKFSNSVVSVSADSEGIQVLGYEKDFPINVAPVDPGVTTGYRLISNKDVANGIGKPLAVGRDFENNLIYAAVGQVFNEATGKMETVVGSVHNGDRTEAWVVDPENKGWVLDQFDVLACEL